MLGVCEEVCLWHTERVRELCDSLQNPLMKRKQTHTHTRARAHARTHTHSHFDSRLFLVAIFNLVLGSSASTAPVGFVHERTRLGPVNNERYRREQTGKGKA